MFGLCLFLNFVCFREIAGKVLFQVKYISYKLYVVHPEISKEISYTSYINI